MPRMSPVHYVSPSAVSITANVNGSYNDLAVNVMRGTKIKVFSKGIPGLDFQDGAFREWTLSGRNRRLAYDTSPYTIYARLSKADVKNAYLVFAPKQQDGGEWKDKYPYVLTKGLAKDTADSETGEYWYVRMGDVSLPESGKRIVTFDTGLLGTEQYNSEWALNPDGMPTRVELTCTIDGEDAGPTPYVPWGKTTSLQAHLVEGWLSDISDQVKRWTIERNTGDTNADDVWNHPVVEDGEETAEPERTDRVMDDGLILLRHVRDDGDDFNGVVSATFTATAWGEESDNIGEVSEAGEPDTPSDPTLIVLATGTITIMAETVEKYELMLSESIVYFNPLSGEYRPKDSITVSIRATDQKTTIYRLTASRIQIAHLSAAYAPADSDVWSPLVFSGTDDTVAIATIPVTVFQLHQNVKVRLTDPSGHELDTKSISFLCGGEDTAEREWIFLRSEGPVSFGEADSLHPLPVFIKRGQVEPTGEADGSDADKDQTGWVPQGWWDDMRGTDETWRYEYASIRDYIREEDGTGHWGDFATPIIWSRYAQDAVNYRCRWTLNGTEIWQVSKPKTHTLTDKLPLVATLMKRQGNGTEDAVEPISTVITVRFDGLEHSKIVTAPRPQLIISQDENSDLIDYLNDGRITGVSVTFAMGSERLIFAIPAVTEADGSNIRDSIEYYGGDMFLSKTNNDVAKGLITFLKGLKVGDGTYGIGADGTAQLLSLVFSEILKSDGAINGFEGGRGIWMDALQGLIQTDGLEVRGFMRVMELIINRLQLMESDYSFTEGAEVEHIDYVDGGQRLRLWIHKEHDNDYAPFYEGDILYMKVNNLLPRGAAVPDGHTSTKNGSYYTVWMWVDEVDYTDNTITVSLYQSRQSTGAPIVPAGRNFTPYGSPIIDQAYPAEVLMEEMNIEADVASANNVVLAVTGDTLGEAGFDTNLTLTRHGNTGASSDPQIHRSQLGRQQSWVLSTTDQRLSFFWHVDAPIISDDNYALCLGMLPNLANLPSTRNPEMPSLYINTIFYEFSHHIHYPSRIVKEDRGEWVQPDAAGVPPQPYATYTGDSGSWTPDGTLTWENIQDDIAEGRIPANRAKRETIDFLLSLAGTYDDEGHLIAPYTYTTGQDVFEPYHFESITAVQWLSQRLSSSNDRWTDRELYLKVIIEWHLDLETSRVRYMGSLWECLKEGSATTPWYDNAEWLLIRGSDIRLTLMITKRFLRQSDFSGNRVATTMAFQLTMADNDVTSNVAADHVEWTRQTVGADEDTDESRALKSMDEWWNTYRGYHKLTIPVSSSDLPSNFWTVREVQFTCTVYLDGMESPQQRSLVLH